MVETDSADGVGKATRLDRSDAVEDVEASPDADATERDPPVMSAATVDRLAKALKTGELTHAEVREQLIERAVRGGVSSSACEDLVADIRAEVAAVLENDPVLRSLLQR